MHILVIPSFYPSAIRPLTGSFFEDQVFALRRAGHTVRVLVAPRLWETLAYIRHYRTLPPLIEFNDDQSLWRTHALWVPRFFPLLSASIYGRAAVRAYARYEQQHGRPDIIHAHNVFYGGYMAARVSAETGVPAVLTEHSSSFLRGRIFLSGQHHIVQQTFSCMRRVTTVSGALAATLGRYEVSRDQIVVIGNLVDTDHFSREEDRSRSDRFVFATVGHMTRVKRFDLLLQAFALAARDLDLFLEFGGGGREFERIARKVGELGIAEKVVLHGPLNRAQVRDLFQRSSAVVSSSAVETFGVTLIEAMACGKPVIATRSGGPEDFVTPDTGILVPVGDVAAMARAMLDMVRSYARYDPEVIRAYVEARYGEAAYVRRLETIYVAAITETISG
jgi:L-malate glycosyltransferase